MIKDTVGHRVILRRLDMSRGHTGDMGGTGLELRDHTSKGDSGLLHSNLGPAIEELHVLPRLKLINEVTSGGPNNGGSSYLSPSLILTFFILEAPEFEGCLLSI